MLEQIQNEFRPGRSLEDDLFVLMQCMQISTAQQLETVVASVLDIEGAYDNIDRDVLWEFYRR